MPQVGKLTHKTIEDIELPIHFNQKTGLFSCTYLGNTYEDTGFASLKTKVLQAIEAGYTLDWLAVIAMNVRIGDYSLAGRREDRQTCAFYLSQERKYIGYHKMLGYRQVEWQVEPNERLQACRKFHWEEATFALPVQTLPNSMGEVSVYLPYSNELWEQLEEAGKYLTLAMTKLRGSFGSSAEVSTTLAVLRSLFDYFETREEE